jgi:hypothetical protein
MLNNDSSYGWRDPAVSEKWNIVARNVDVKNDAGDVIGTKVVSVFEPTGTTQSNRLVELADFSVVDNMLLDSW